MLKRNLTDDSWKRVKEILIFGYGRQGKKNYEMLKRDFRILAVIENDLDKIGKNVDNCWIMGIAEAIKAYPKTKIIVTTSQRYYQDIAKELKLYGLKENIDFVMYQTFIVEWYFERKGELRIPKVDLPITSFCSLNCEHCHVFLPYWKKHEHYPTAELIKSLDSLFDCVDYVFDMDLVGGEPFLHPEIERILEYLGEKYRGRIGYLGIITNGTVVPKSETLSVIRRFDINVSISDYSKVIDYQGSLTRLIDLLEEYEISYMRNTSIEWYDFCFPRTKKSLNHEETVIHYKKCNTIFHTLSNKRLFGCGTAWAAEKSGLYINEKEEFVDLDKDKKYVKRMIAELSLNQIEDGCFSFCSHCGGFGEDNRDVVPTAKQIIQ